MITLVPRHRRATSITAQPLSRHVHFEGVAPLFRPDVGLLQPEFFAIINRWRAAQREQQHCRNARLIRSDTARDAWPVMITEHPVWPSASRERALVLIDQLRDLAGMPSRAQQHEVEREMHP